MLDGEIEHYAPADRAAHDHGTVERERPAERDDHVGIARRREPVLLVLEALGRKRLAVPRHVEGEQAKVPGDLLVRHQVAELTSVGAGRVQANERNALPRFLEIETVRAAVEREPQIAAGDRLERRAGHDSPPALRRGSTNRSFMYCRLAISGCR